MGGLSNIVNYQQEENKMVTRVQARQKGVTGYIPVHRPTKYGNPYPVKKIHPATLNIWECSKCGRHIIFPHDETAYCDLCKNSILIGCGPPSRCMAEDYARESSIEKYIDMVINKKIDDGTLIDWLGDILDADTIACFCPLQKLCHADALLYVIEKILSNSKITRITLADVIGWKVMNKSMRAE